MVKIRLSRFGKKNDPFYRIVAIDENKKTTGQSLDKIGFWHPRTNTKQIDKTKLKNWVSKGAIITAAVGKLLI